MDPNMSTNKVCEGCGKDYSIPGYIRHLRTTTKAPCIARRIAEQHYHADSSSDDERDVAALPRDSDSGGGGFESPPPQPFEGDCLGPYDEDYWNDYDEYDGPPDEEGDAEGVEPDEDNEDGEDGDEGEYAYGWEAPQRALTPEAGEAAEEDVPAPGKDAPDREAQQRAHRHINARTHVVPFPGGLAGAPLSEPPSESSYETFQAEVDANGTNPYAPFVSRMDWEVARWAKMRGPGSTALTELLNIDDVRVLHIDLSWTPLLIELPACLPPWSVLQDIGRAQ